VTADPLSLGIAHEIWVSVPLYCVKMRDGYDGSTAALIVTALLASDQPYLFLAYTLNLYSLDDETPFSWIKLRSV
jgi:hypothetical protein